MGGSSFEDEWARGIFRRIPTRNRTIVLVGKTGNGKSSTGNSIIGREAFKSEMSLNGVTTTCEMQTTIENNRIINVIDTPGLFDSSVEVEQIVREIVKGINMGKDGIHAVVVVFSVIARFSQEECDVIEKLRKFFGNRISDYMIVVFTGGDGLGEKSLDDFLRDCPELLKKTLRMCGNRYLKFDNKTDNAVKKSEQLHQLLALVDYVVNDNGGKPYTDELFAEVKGKKYLTGASEVDSSAGSSKHNVSEINEQLEKITEKVENKLKVTSRWVEEQVANERAARLKAESEAKEAQNKSNEEIRILREKLERAEKEAGELLREQIRRDNFEKQKKMQSLRYKLKRAEELRKEAEDFLKKKEPLVQDRCAIL